MLRINALDNRHRNKVTVNHGKMIWKSDAIRPPDYRIEFISPVLDESSLVPNAVELLALNYIENRNSASTIVTSGQASYDVVNIPPLEIKRSDEIIIHVGRLLDDSLWGSYNLSKKDDINSDDLLDGFWYVFSRRDASDVFNSMMGSLELKINFAKNSSDVMMLTDLVDVVKPFCSSTYRHDLILAIQGMISILNEDKGQYDAMRNDYESENHANMGYWGNRYDNAKYIGFLRNIFQSLDDSNRTQIKRHIGRMGI